MHIYIHSEYTPVIAFARAHALSLYISDALLIIPSIAYCSVCLSLSLTLSHIVCIRENRVTADFIFDDNARRSLFLREYMRNINGGKIKCYILLLFFH